MAGTYDTTEASDLLGRVAGAHMNFETARHAAGVACLAQFEALLKEIDPDQKALYALRHQLNVLEVGMVGGASIRYAVRGDGIAVKPGSGSASVLELSYNAGLDILEGPVEPTALGQPKRRRSALAVLADAAVDALGRSYED